MPGHLLHIQLAQKLLDEPRRRPDWHRDLEAVNALFHGAVGPDMGYFPGGDGLLSGLAHYVRPVALAGAILEKASSNIEVAYAWGWITHILADAAVHQIVNRAAGLVHFGTSDRPSTAADSLATHVRVEVGLDAVRMARDPAAENFRLQPVFDAGTIGFLCEAFRDTYELDFETTSLLRSHRAVTRFQPLLFRGVALVGRRLVGTPLRRGDLPLLLLYEPARWLSGLARDSIVFGVTHSLIPPPWMEDEVTEILVSFPETFHRHLAVGLADLPDINLDTGEPEDLNHPYVLAEQTRRDLRRRHLSSKSPPAL